MMKWLPRVSRKTVYFHIAAWLIYILIMYRHNLNAYPDRSVGRIVVLVVLLALVFYGLLSLLFWFFRPSPKRRSLRPVLCSVLVFLLFMWLYVYAITPALGWKIYREDRLYSHGQFMANAGRVLKEMGKYAAIYFLLYHNIRKERRLARLMTNLHILRQGLHHFRLQGLGARVAPHFLMNAFNRCYSLIYHLNEGLAERLLHLSEIIKYGMGDRDELGLRTVLLKRELSETGKLLNAYYGQETEEMPIRLLCMGSMRAFRVPAFTIICCVENILKYAVLDAVNKQAVLRVVTAGDTLLITAINGVAKRESNRVSRSSGLKDLKARLQHLLGQRFRLSYWQEDNLFILLLAIERH
ncbi:histidine kinase [Olivibacter sp. XZL3]|uniref:histidine kinase n=1 Tax=Olivibacter sp. XZL3 TaxID=1735116 RepID=UPI0010655242|nr:histidine kinase [Olivibacter sp. XZL3]